MNLEEIFKKHSYDNETQDVIKKLYPELVRYFNNEPIVFQTLLNTKIELCSNVYECLFNNNLLDDEMVDITHRNNLIRSAGAYDTNPDIVYDENENKYLIKKENRVIAIKGNTFDKYTTITLIHELCHAIKSTYEEHSFFTENNEDYLIEKSGFVVRKFKLTHEGPIVKKELVSEIGIGLEEGLNVIAEEEISKNVGYKDYISTRYEETKKAALSFLELEIKNLKNKVAEYELYHDYSFISNELIEEFLFYLKSIDMIYETDAGLIRYENLDGFTLKSFIETHERFKRKIKEEMVNNNARNARSNNS